MQPVTLTSGGLFCCLKIAMACATCGQARAITDRLAQAVVQPRAAANEQKITLRYYGMFTSPVNVMGSYYFGDTDGYREQDIPRSLVPLFVSNRGAVTPKLQQDPIRNGRQYLIVNRADAEALVEAGEITGAEPVEAFVVPDAALEQRTPESPAVEPVLPVVETQQVDPAQPSGSVAAVAAGAKAAKKKRGG